MSDEETYFSLCQGIGGFDDGLNKAGFKCVGGCEIGEYAKGISYYKYKGIKIWKDATKVDPKDLPDFGLLTCGFPCPTFSVAGNRAGFDDPRGQIFFEIIRIAKAKRPKVLLLENVKGLLSHDKGRTLGVMVDLLVSCGYSVQWQVINSKYKVPQNRERIYIVGYLGKECPREVLPIFPEDGGDVRKDKAIKKVGSVNKAQSGNVYSTEGIATTLCSGGGGQGAKTGLYEEPEMKHKNMTEHNGSRVYDTDGISPTLMAGEGTGSRVKIDEPKINIIRNKNPSGHGQSGNIYSADGLAPTLTAGMGAKQNSSGFIEEPNIKRTEGNPNVYNTDAQAGKVYDTDGISPTVTGQRINSQGFIEEPKIKKVIDGPQGYRVYDPSGINQCLTAEAGGFGAKMGLIPENKYCTCSEDIAVVHEKRTGLKQTEGGKANTLCATYYKGYDNRGNRTMIMNVQKSGRGGGKYETRVKEGFGQVGTGNGGNTRGEETLVKSVKPIITPDREKKRQNGRRIKDDGEPAHTLTAQDRHGVVIENKKICAECGGEVGSDTGSNHLQPSDRTRIRRLTPVECERLQGFEDNSTKYGLFKKVKGRLIADPKGDVVEISDTQRYKTLGNAVTVPVIEEIALRLKGLTLNEK